MFLNALMLMGIGAAAAPLLLHLLNRARYRSVDWGAMLFLEAGDRRQRQSSRLHQWLLMLVRMAIVAGLALALARPVLRAGASAGSGPGCSVIVLDCSASMGFDVNGQTRMDLARLSALRLLESMPGGERVALVLAGQDDGLSRIAATSDLDAIGGRIRSAEIGAGNANLVDAMSSAFAILKDEQAAGAIYVICDRQASNWPRPGDGYASILHDRAGLSRPNVQIIPVGGIEANNVAVESIDFPGGPPARAQSADVEVTLHNDGDVEWTDLPISISMDDRVVEDKKVDLAANSTIAIRAALKIDAAGPHIITALLAPNGLTADDRLDYAVQIDEPARVLVVSGDQRNGAFRSEADFFRVAVAPSQLAGGNPATDAALIDVKATEEPWQQDLERYQVLVLANVERIGALRARQIERFVYNGGGVLIALGNLCRAQDYNDVLYRNGEGILPAQILSAAAGDGSAATSLLGINLDHPVFRFLRGQPSPIPTATISRYFSCRPRDPQRVLASFVSGAPFLLENISGRGRVLLMTTSLDADWSTLPLSSFYLPFTQSLVRYLAQGTLPQRNILTGQPIRLVVPTADETASAMIKLPDGTQKEVEVDRAGQAFEARYEETTKPGRYHLIVKSAGQETASPFVVRSTLRESDLAQLSEQDWRHLSAELGALRVEPASRRELAAVNLNRNGRELWSILLTGVVLLALVELLIAKTFSIETKK